MDAQPVAAAPDATRLEQYKSYVDDLAKLGARHTEASKFFASIQSALLVFLSLTGTGKPLNSIGGVAVLAVALVGILLCLLWFFTVRSYAHLYTAKFHVLRELERGLAYECYREEYEKLREMGTRPVGLIDRFVYKFLPRGHKPVTFFEMLLVLALIVPFLLLALSRVFA